MTGCEKCGEGDELLFTCSHCDDQFCAAHQFPHHACSRFTDAGRAEAAEAEQVGFEFGDGTTVVTPVTEEPDAEPEEPTIPSSTPTSEPPTAEVDEAFVPGPRVEVARDAARETRPDRDGPDPLPPNRGMPWERGSGSIADWMAAQSYPSYVLRIGLLSLLFTAAYYGGLAATLYGYV